MHNFSQKSFGMYSEFLKCFARLKMNIRFMQYMSHLSYVEIWQDSSRNFNCYKGKNSCL
jgi:hypothetical protein